MTIEQDPSAPAPAPHSPLRAEVAAFFDAFVQDFASFDGAQVGRRYLAPYVALHTPGSIELFASPGEIAPYFQQELDRYHETGCRSCRYTDLEVMAMGTQCALASVTWELCAGDGKVLSTWRESYNLARQGRELFIFATIDHAH
jgi:hypothetical protein